MDGAALASLRGWARRAWSRIGGANARRDAALAAELAQLHAAVGDLTARLQAQTGDQARTEIRWQELDEWQRLTGQGFEQLRDWLTNVEAAQAVLGADAARLAARVPGDDPLYGDGTIALETFDAGLGGRVVGFRDRAPIDAGDGLYLRFEDYFRGDERAIGERQRAYLPVLEDYAPVLDVGCGRGELLELLRAARIAARGIDVDSGMVERCRAKGLDVQRADALSHLRVQADGSVGAIVALQVIEHLPNTELVELLRTSTAKLRPGGRLVVETVNPHCPQALKHFWIDPTHQHPLYPEIVVALCSLVGFGGAFIWHPGGSGDPDRDRVQRHDYAVVAQTASEGAAAGELVDDPDARP